MPLKLVGVPEHVEEITAGVRLVGRDGFLPQIAAKLDAASTVALVPSDQSDTVSLHGMGGVGKTALAIEYCRSRQADVFATIWWVDAENSSSVSRSYDTYKAEFGVHVPEGEDARPYVDAHVGGQANCLIVYDNVEDRSGLNKLRPPNFSGAVLVTSRTPAGWDESGVLAVDVLDLEPARDWLLFAANSSSILGQPVKDLDQTDVENATWLAGKEAINGLALALRMATSYLKRSQCGLERYRELYEADSSTVLDSDKSADIPADYQRTVYVTFGITLKKLILDGEVEARALLEISSFYAPDDIPKWIFTDGSLDSDRADALEVAVMALSGLALITHTQEKFSIHRVIQEVTRYYLQHPEKLPDPDLVDARLTNKTVTFAVMSAEPLNKTRIDAETSVAEVQAALDQSALKEQIEFVPVPKVTAESLRRVLDSRPAVVQFICHGDPERGLLLRDSHVDTKGSWASSTSLRNMFSDAGVQLVVLAGCHTESVARELHQVVPSVIGTTDFLSAPDGRRFLTEVTKELAAGRKIREATRRVLETVSVAEGSDVFLDLTVPEDVSLFS